MPTIALWQLAVAYLERSELVLGTEELLHHRAVGTEAVLQWRRWATGLKDADLDRHGCMMTRGFRANNHMRLTQQENVRRRPPGADSAPVTA
jgi:hypothetical protein